MSAAIVRWILFLTTLMTVPFLPAKDPMAPPPAPPPLRIPATPPRVFCFRVTDIERVPGTTSSFVFEFEVLNWTGVPVHGLMMAVTTATTKVGATGFPNISWTTIPALDIPGVAFGGASIDSDGRGGAVGQPPGANEIGVGVFDSPAIHSGRGRGDLGPGVASNDWIATLSTPTLATWGTAAVGTPVPPRDVMTAMIGGDLRNCWEATNAVARLVPGARLTAVTGPAVPVNPSVFGCGGRPPFVDGVDALGDLSADGGPGVMPNPIPAGTGNALDGFTLTIDDFDEGETLSFNWFLLDASGTPIGSPPTGISVAGCVGASCGGPLPAPLTCCGLQGNGNPMGYGTFTLERLPPAIPIPPGADPALFGMAGVTQTPYEFYDGVFALPNPTQFAAEFGSGLTGPFMNASDNLFGVIPNTAPYCAVVPANGGVADPGFDGQVGGPTLAPPWSAFTGPNIPNAATIETRTSSDGAGFPRAGRNWLRMVSSGLTFAAQPSGFSCGFQQGTVTEVRQTLVIPQLSSNAVMSFAWTWQSGEAPQNGTFDDFATIDLVDVTFSSCPQHVQNLLFVDSNASLSLTNIPGSAVPPAGVIVPFVNTGTKWEVAPVGPKRALVPIPASLSGRTLELRIVCGNAGAAINNVSVLKVDEIYLLDAVACAQPNTPFAGFAFAGGSGCAPTTVQPGFRSYAPGETMVATCFGNANAPFMLIAGSAVSHGSVIAPFGVLNLSPALSLMPIVDGIGSGAPPGSLGNTGSLGVQSVNFTMPALPTGPFAGFQAVVTDPGSSSGFTLTAATHINVENGIPSNFVGTTIVSIPGNGSVFVPFGSGFTFPYYGVARTGVFVNENGTLSFGAALPTAVESVAALTSAPAKIAVMWDDYDTSVAGQIAYAQTPTTFTVSWTNVRQTGAASTDSSTFGVILESNGSIRMAWGRVDSSDGIIGISNGAPTPPAKSFTWFSQLGTITGAAGQALYEQWPQPGSGFCPPAGGTIVIRPIRPGAVAGASGYRL